MPTGQGLHGWDGPNHREREIKDARNTRDTGVGSKREDQPSSSSRKRQKTSASHEFRTKARIGHVRRDCPRDRDSRTLGQCSPS